MASSKKMREITGAIKDAGFAIEEMWYGRHWRIEIAYKGIKKTMTFTANKSDWRAVRNFKAQLNNIKREIEGLT